MLLFIHSILPSFTAMFNSEVSLVINIGEISQIFEVISSLPKYFIVHNIRTR